MPEDDTTQTPGVPHVLIADDDPWTRESLGLLLRDEGYAVIEAVDGVQTVDLLHLSREPLLVLLDLVLPTMTGVEVLSYVAHDDLLSSRHRYIVLSASPYRYASQVGPHFSELLERLHVPFVEKPFELDALLQVVAETHPVLAARRQSHDDRQAAG